MRNKAHGSVLHPSFEGSNSSLQMGTKKHKTWKDNMTKAITAVMKKEMGLLPSSKVFASH